ncbi:Uncharacterized protein GBIM_15487 [Gryllus bimaculatus]|nr:Uncharacterized protein GBIM_15487 [Gryllus bimaculatus]
MEGVQVIVLAARDFWDEFHITKSKFLPNYENCSVLEQNSTDVRRNSGIALIPHADCLHYVCSNETRMKTRIIGNPYFISEGVTRYEYEQERYNFKQCYKTQMNGHLLSVFVNTLKASEIYRTAVITHLLQCKNIEQNKCTSMYPLKLIIQLSSPKKEIIDYSWNERMLTMALERRELDHAMSWFSTLGGAFSALGDHFDHCALVAGQISIKQLKLALRLGDPMTVARCKLYLALSLLQRGYLTKAKHIIKEQYQFATTSPVIDMRLIRMCQGIWAKLKYSYQMKQNEKKK